MDAGFFVMFRFKRFAVDHSDVAMKVGTDGVLLGAWCPLERRPYRVLDVGTGTGLLALMVAQRGEEWGCKVDAVEIDTGAAEQAYLNFEASPWNERLKVYNTDIQEFTNEQRAYDLIISNPPFFEESLLPPDSRRAAARHTCGLSHKALIGCVGRFLSGDGIFSVILPVWCVDPFVEIAMFANLHVLRRTDVRPVAGKLPKRSLLSFGRESESNAVYDELVIEYSRHDFTPEYKALTKDFYLKF